MRMNMYDPAKTTPLVQRAQEDETNIHFVPVETSKYKTQELVEAFAESIFGSIPSEPMVLHCSACGQEAIGDELFCVMCGEFLEESEMVAATPMPTCSECDTQISADDVFCLLCGATI
jgi:hypothetical protein